MPNGKQKYDGGKSDPTLVFESLAEALVLVTRVRDYGVAKYGARDGWKEVPNGMQRYTAAQLRHMMATLMGREFDDESGLLELGHEACNALFRLQFKIEELIEAADKMAPGGGEIMWQELQKFNDPHAKKSEVVHPTAADFDEMYPAVPEKQFDPDWSPLLSDRGSGKPLEGHEPYNAQTSKA